MKNADQTKHVPCKCDMCQAFAKVTTVTVGGADQVPDLMQGLRESAGVQQYELKEETFCPENGGTMLDGLFWFLLGVISGAVIYSLIIWTIQRAT